MQFYLSSQLFKFLTMINNSFSETAKAALDLRDTLKCLACKLIPEEPYLTGVCDHILCKICISKKNTCPICGASFYKKEASMNKMFKEAILYVNEIIKLTDSNLNLNKANEINQTNNKNDIKNKSDDVEENSDSSLPDLDLTGFDEKINDRKNKENNKNDKKSSKNNEIKTSTEPLANKSNEIFAAPLPPSIIKQTLTSQINKKSDKVSSTQSQKNIKKSSAKGKSTQMPSLITSIDESQLSRTQSNSKKVRKNLKGETPLHIAVNNRDLEKVKELLQDSSTDVNATDNSNWTPLHEACYQGNLEIIKLLIDYNANINAPGRHKNTPLHEATVEGRYECCEYLLELGANQMLKNELGVLPKDLVKNNKKLIDLYEKFKSNNNSNNNNNNSESNNLELSQSQFNVSNIDDLDISCTFSKITKKGKSNKNLKKVTLYGSSMQKEDKDKFSTLAKNLNLTIAKEMNNNVTHVVFCGSAKTCNRTLNYLKAILMGIWVVNIKWLEDSVEKGILLEENDYEATGSIKLPNSNGPFKGRLNVSANSAKLFEDCFFFLNGEFETFTKQEFIKLIETGGGIILKREPKLERLDELMPKELPPHLDNKTETCESFCCSHFILYDKTSIKEIRNKYLNTVKPLWLFSCIEEFKIMKP